MDVGLVPCVSVSPASRGDVSSKSVKHSVAKTVTAEKVIASVSCLIIALLSDVDTGRDNVLRVDVVTSVVTNAVLGFSLGLKEISGSSESAVVARWGKSNVVGVFGAVGKSEASKQIVGDERIERKKADLSYTKMD